jgi:hypothetical protein
MARPSGARPLRAGGDQDLLASASIGRRNRKACGRTGALPQQTRMQRTCIRFSNGASPIIGELVTSTEFMSRMPMLTGPSCEQGLEV